MAKKPKHEPADNYLFCGDNLDMLAHILDESVDLIYLDPPFKSEQNYNVLFEEKAGVIGADGDTHGR